MVDGQPDDHIRRVGDDFAYVLAGPGAKVVGFGLGGLTSFDVDAHPELWEGPHFDAPLFGLRDVPAAAIVLAARARLGRESTTNRVIFRLATNAEGEEAVGLWGQRCHQSPNPGDPKPDGEPQVRPASTFSRPN